MSKQFGSNKTIKCIGKMLGRLAGLPLVYIGVIVLVASYVFGWSHINTVLFAGLGFVVAGVVSYIIITKKDSRY